jgi:hypothetical protein
MITIVCNDEAVAAGDLTAEMTMSDVVGLPDVVLTLYYFSQIRLAPKIVFRHLTGVPLKTWLDEADLLLPEGSGGTLIGPLRYIHGRSEALKGKTSTSAVLLARLNQPVPEATWTAAIPGIYKRFTQQLDTREKKIA